MNDTPDNQSPVAAIHQAFKAAQAAAAEEMEQFDEYSFFQEFFDAGWDARIEDLDDNGGAGPFQFELVNGQKFRVTITEVE